MNKNNSTLDFYNNNARTYVENTIHVDFVPLYEDFLSHLKNGDHILDVGVGSGRDSLYFINQGYKVTAIDPSEALASIASDVIKQEVLVTKAEDMTFNKEFNGVWAMSSLIHLNDEQLDRAIGRIKEAMVDGGYFWGSFRNSPEETTDPKGRYFNGFTVNKLECLFAKHFENISIVRRDDSMGRSEISWLELLATKKPELQLKKNVVASSKTKKKLSK